MKKLLPLILAFLLTPSFAQNISRASSYKKISTYEVSHIDMSCQGIKEAKREVNSCAEAYLLTRAGIGCWMNADENLQNVSLTVAASPVPVGLLGSMIVYGLAAGAGGEIAIAAGMLVIPTLYLGSKIKRMTYTKVAKLIEASKRCVENADCAYKELGKMSRWVSRRKQQYYDNEQIARFVNEFVSDPYNCLAPTWKDSFKVMKYGRFRKELLKTI